MKFFCQVFGVFVPRGVLLTGVVVTLQGGMIDYAASTNSDLCVWSKYVYVTLNYGCVYYSYLHKNDIVHGNLSLATIFIQHNGLVKIGSGMSD